MSPRAVITTVGRRKTAIARLKVNKKDDDALKLTINEKDFDKYFPTAEIREAILKPLKSTGSDKLNASIKVSGGGVMSQADAVRHALARAVLKMNPDAKTVLRSEGHLTRDPRRKERKKPGLKKARRAPQWSKR